MSILSVRAALPSAQLALASRNTTVSFLSSPSDYIATLKLLCRSASKQITLSALYLGNKKHEMDLISELDQALSDSSRPDLKVTFVLDHSRAGRGDSANPSSVMVLAGLVNKYYPRCSILLYQMPQLRGLKQFLPTQLKEILGVYHCKFSVFDNTAILTGANLSEEYFVNRQDRYVMFSGGTTVDAGNQAVNRDDSCIENPLSKVHSNAQQSRSSLSESNSLVTFLSNFVSILDKYCHHLLPGNTIESPSSSYTDEDLRDELNSLSGFSGTSSRAGTDSSSTLSGAEVILQPLIQHRPIGINQEEIGMLELLRTISETKRTHSRLVISSPYPSFSELFMLYVANYSSTIENSSKALHSSNNQESIPLLSKKTCDSDESLLLDPNQKSNLASSTYIVIPSHNAHGFAKGSGLKAMVPKLHSSAMLTSVGYFWSHYSKQNSQNNQTTHGSSGVSSKKVDSVASPLMIKAFEHSNWTFHAKGIWYLEIDNKLGLTKVDHDAYNKATENSSLPVDNITSPLSYIGSSNLGARSLARDFELGFVLSTNCSQLQGQLGRECVDLLGRTRDVNYLAEKSKDSVFIRIISNLLRSVL